MSPRIATTRKEKTPGCRVNHGAQGLSGILVFTGQPFSGTIFRMDLLRVFALYRSALSPESPLASDSGYKCVNLRGVLDAVGLNPARNVHAPGMKRFHRLRHVIRIEATRQKDSF